MGALADLGSRETGLKAPQMERGAVRARLAAASYGEGNVGRASAVKQVGNICGDPFSGLGRACRLWSLSGRSRGVLQSEGPGKPLEAVGRGLRTGSPPPGFTVAMAAAGLSRPQLFHPCKYVQKKSQPKLADRIAGNERRNNPGCSLLGAVRQTPPQDCLAGGGGRIPSGECWEDAGIPPHHGLP